VLTVSDTRGPDDDRSGAVARERIESAGHAVCDYRVVPDDPEKIRDVVEGWLASEGCDAVVVSGGTGISTRDRTYEAIDGLLDRRLDGFGELFRMLSFEQVGSAAMLSRAVGGIARRTPLFALPGSPRAVQLALDRLILPQLGHLLAELRK
jgi:molybdenum cofactor biosynthesis protein B